MLNQALAKALNDQFNKELYASHLYLSISAYFEAQNLPGFAHWMRAQAAEEREHAERFYNYLVDRDARIRVGALEEPPAEFASPLKAFEAALEHEREITASINAIYDLAVKEKDYATQAFLDWFVTEQVEEEKSVKEVIDMLKLMGESGHGLLVLDHKLSSR